MTARAALVLVAVLAASACAVTVRVGERGEECALLEAHEHDVGRHADLDVSVVRGGRRDILIEVRYLGGTGNATYDERGEVVLQKGYTELYHHQDGAVEIPLSKEGIYAVCFNNRESRFISKVVEFHLTIDETVLLATTHQDAVRQSDVKRMEDRVRDVFAVLQGVSHEYKHYNNRVDRSHKTVASTKARVATYSLLACVTIIAVTAGETIILKRWFSRSGRSR
eukprot:TRINITY_DN6230_c0_g1_i1.p2 TRINITY_DN6230_c0_g1~~TRINITY_DN6230_c0_g1_i1.p2  ORF type:complete len:224 (-),score=62.91 TRINITY_DN6230_c0_g1_i1:66-737(-)